MMAFRPVCSLSHQNPMTHSMNKITSLTEYFQNEEGAVFGVQRGTN